MSVTDKSYDVYYKEGDAAFTKLTPDPLALVDARTVMLNDWRKKDPMKSWSNCLGYTEKNGGITLPYVITGGTTDSTTIPYISTPWRYELRQG